MKISDLNPSPYNPRKITDQELANLTASIRERWAEFVHGEGCDWEALTPRV